MVAAPLPLGAVERGAVADRDEGVLKARAARMVGVHVAGRHRGDAERRREVGEPRVPARVAALVRALELDVERTGKRPREPRGGVRVGDAEPVASAAGEADEPLGVRGDELGGRRGLQQLPLAARDTGAGVGVGEDPAEVLVAAAALAEQRDVRRSAGRAGTSAAPTARKRDLGARDRPQAELPGGVGELERAVDAVVVGERERVVAELDRPGRELFRERCAVEKRVRRMRMELDVSCFPRSNVHGEVGVSGGGSSSPFRLRPGAPSPAKRAGDSDGVLRPWLIRPGSSQNSELLPLRLSHVLPPTFPGGRSSRPAA